jgi:hypothetical protein
VGGWASRSWAKGRIGTSAFGIIRLAWQKLWASPPVFNLVMWDLLISVAVVSVYSARLASYVPKAITNPTDLLNRHTNLVLAPGVALRLGLFLATVLLIVTPLRVAGLYGGAAEAVDGDRRRPWLYFFAVGRRMFWRGLVITLLGAGLAVVLVALGVGASLLGGPIALSALALLVWLALVLVAVTLALRGLGELASGDHGVAESVRAVLAWGWEHVAFCLGFGLLVAVLMFATLLVLDALATVALLGALMAFAGLWVVTGMLAVIPTVLYRTTAA